MSSKLQLMETRNYKLIYAPNTGGAFFLERVSDGYSTGLFTASEGQEDYECLKTAYNIAGELFDTLCAEHSFNYDKEGNLL